MGDVRRWPAIPDLALDGQIFDRTRRRVSVTGSRLHRGHLANRVSTNGVRANQEESNALMHLVPDFMRNRRRAAPRHGDS